MAGGGVSAQSSVPNLDTPYPTRYIGMGFSGVAVSDPTYGIINPVAVGMWIADGGIASLSRIGLDGYPGHGRQTEALGIRVLDLTTTGQTVISVGISHSRHRANSESLPPYDPEGDERIHTSSLTDDYMAGIALRHGIEIAGAFRWTRNEMDARTADTPGPSSHSVSTVSSSGGIIRVRAGEVLRRLGGGRATLGAGPFRFDGEAAYAGVAYRNESRSGYTVALSTMIADYSLLSARIVRDSYSGTHASGWELSALGAVSLRGGERQMPPYAVPRRSITHGFAIHLGGVLGHLRRRHDGILAWISTHSNLTYEKARSPRSEWTGWYFSLSASAY